MMFKFRDDKKSKYNISKSFSDKSSIKYADFLSLDDDLFFHSLNYNADTYSSNDFPGCELVNKEIVFSQKGYTNPPLPFLKFSLLSFFLTISGLIIFILNLFSVPFIAENGHNTVTVPLFLLNLFLLALSLLSSLQALKKPHSRYYRGRSLAKISYVVSGIYLGMLIWLGIIIFF